MGKFKAEIRASYLNPVMLLSPVLTFIIVNYAVGLEVAGPAAVITAVLLTVYAGAMYRVLFRWYVFHTLIFLAVVALMGGASLLFRHTAAHDIADKAALLISFAGLYALKRPIVKASDRLVSPLMPMSNNIAELYSMVKVFIILSGLYIAAYLTFFFIGHGQLSPYFKIINFTSILFILLLILFYTLKTALVRIQLGKERWLPIITKNGKIVGAIQRLSSLSDRRKFTHPVVRGALIKDGRILLQTPAETGDLFYRPCWDTFIDNHIDLGDQAEECLKKTAFERYGIKDVKSLYLTRYTEETEYEFQYALLFVIGHYSGEITPCPDKIARMKWWTVPQIEANLGSGIFDRRFIREYELLKRAGLFDK